LKGVGFVNIKLVDKLAKVFKSKEMEKVVEEPSSKKESEYITLDWDEEKKVERPDYYVKVMTLMTTADVDAILDEYRTLKKIIIVKVASELAKNKPELKRYIKRFQKTCMNINGDIVAMSEDLFILSPPKIAIERRKVEEVKEEKETQAQVTSGE